MNNTKQLVNRLRDAAQGLSLGADGMSRGPDNTLLTEAADEIESFAIKDLVCRSERVKQAFVDLKLICIYRDMTDCEHPDMDVKHMLCDPSNCPLL